MPVYKQDKTKDGRCWFFMINYRDLRGNTKQYKSKKYLTKKEAQDAERDYTISLEKGENVTDMTFKDLYNAFYEFKAPKVKPTTIKTYKNRYPFFEMLFNIRIKDFTISHFEMWKKEMYKFNISNAYRNDIFKLLKAMFNFASAYYNFNSNSFYHKMTNFTDPNEAKKEMDFYTYDEFKHFISFEKDLKYKCMFEILYYCGLRRGEARGLSWDNINFEKNTLTVSKQIISTGNSHSSDVISTLKTKSSYRTIPMPKVLADDLKLLLEENKKIDGFNDKFYVLGNIYPIGSSAMRMRKKKIAQDSGLREIRLHDFRHSCASLLINSGANITVVAHYLGHTKIEETLETYTHMYDSALTDVTNVINALA